MDVFGQAQNHLIETYSEECVRRGLSDIDHLDASELKELLEGADAAVIRDPSEVPGSLLAELETSNYKRINPEEHSYRGLYLGDEETAREEIFSENESFETGGNLLR